ncbi:MAG: acetylglutamate kinase [Halobacteriovoraceae bacterium]|nr:acetylglutamate kinase [Halobacteriovoraceae bacterium]|tara:strand:- start:122760 stop:123527 length:768 start_codon:yes stop_codon:yes gene_type:complete
MKIVLKIGGAFLNKYQESTWIEEVGNLYRKGHEIIIVHGAGPYINEAFEKKGISPQFIDGQRVTQTHEVEIVEQVLTHQINPRLAHQFMSRSLPVIGISGLTARTLECSPLDKRLGQVGKVESVNQPFLNDLTKHGVVLLSPIGINMRGHDKFNINADVAAAEIAKSWDATLLFLTGEKGLLDDQGGVITHINSQEVDHMIDNKSIRGGMIIKARMIQSLLAKNSKVALLNAESHKPLEAFIFDKKVQGTLFLPQ